MLPNVRRFVVIPAVPEKLKGLNELAYNIWTLWNFEAAALFRRLDADLWDQTNHNPVKMLNLIAQEKLQVAATDEGFLTHLNRIMVDFRHYMDGPTWYSTNYPKGNARIAYFSAEYGLHESLPIYSGGLGILSGDHMKSVSDLGLPLVGMGLLYRFGYFRQSLNADGWQQEAYPENDFFSLPITQVMTEKNEPQQVAVDFPGRTVHANIWKVQVGRMKLYLLDSNVSSNNPEDRDITARLYGGDQDMRVRQELLLGIGGLLALKKMGYEPTVCHMNEGHSAFLSLERIRGVMEENKLTFRDAAELVAASNVFTTHTPVPAGNDAFHPDIIERYLGHYIPKLGISREQFLDLGRISPGAGGEFGMTVLALRMAWHCNGVSTLHGKVSRDMWAGIWPDVPHNEIPIGSITNGVHTQSWLSDEFSMLYSRYLGANWADRPTDYAMWKRIEKVPDVELWRSHERRREHLVNFVRRRLRVQTARRGATSIELQRLDEILDSDALTIGFARRFATYKRATLLMRNRDRLVKLLVDKQRPVQFIFAGKSHPRDDGGKRFIQEVIKFCKANPEIHARMVFIEDYDINVARYLTQGVDVWLNTPRRPMEASGTSGMKGPINGAINLSILDGWWCECYNGQNGWAIGSEEEFSSDDAQDDFDSQSLFELLEQDVIPTFYDRGADGLPRKWIAKMKNSISTVCSYFNTSRMVQQYFETFYSPANALYGKLAEGKGKGAQTLAAWKGKVRDTWQAVQVKSVEAPTSEPMKAGSMLPINATVDLGKLTPEEVQVELYHGTLDQNGNIITPSRTTMVRKPGGNGDATYMYTGSIIAQNCGQQGFAVRVLPKNTDVEIRMEPNLIRWG